MTRRDPREGEGAIFRTRPESHPLTRENAAAYCDALNSQFAKLADPLDMLREMERVPLGILREIEAEAGDGCEPTRIGGVDQTHEIRLPEDLPAIGRDAKREISALLLLRVELRRETPRIGWIIAAAVQVGYRIAAMQARQHERSVHKWTANQKPLVERQKGTPVTEEARKLLAEGASVRKIAADCNVGYQVARRWKKNF